MNTDKIYTFPEGTLEKELDSFGNKGILQFTVTDKTILTNKQRLLRFINLASKKTPEVLFEFLLDITLLDSETIRAFSNIYCSITILVSPEFFSPKSILRKTYTKKCGLLNQEGLVFGFLVDLENTVENLSLKAFREGIDFLLQQYPNHISVNSSNLKPTAILSTQDIQSLKVFSFGLEVFYTAGRAVPWFLATVAPLKLRPSVFIKDFTEWPNCNNCGLCSKFSIESAQHLDLYILQLSFLTLIFE